MITTSPNIPTKANTKTLAYIPALCCSNVGSGHEYSAEDSNTMKEQGDAMADWMMENWLWTRVQPERAKANAALNAVRQCVAT